MTATQITRDARGVVTVIHKTYGCVRCQTFHFDCEPIYGEHLYDQSKHGTRVATEREHQTHHAPPRTAHPTDHEYMSATYDVCDRCGWSRRVNTEKEEFSE